LIEQLDGKHTPGIGFGSGIERLTLNLKRAEIDVPDEPKPTFMVINVGEAARPAALELAATIRRAGVGAILGNGSRALRGQMRQANALGISYAVVLGDDEIQRGEVVVRDMSDHSQVAKPLGEFLDGLNGSSES
jgi:histidyl-tRNA synthetase